MTIPELILHLSALFPNSFKSELQRNLLTEDYYGVLKDYEGRRLQTAWKAFRRDWRKGWLPKPADLLAYIEPATANTDEFTNADRMAYMERRAPEMMRDWFREHGDIVSAAKRELWFFIPLESELRKRAQFAAQREFNIRHGSHKPALRLEITTDELKRMRRVWGHKPADEAEAPPPKGWKRMKAQNTVRAA